MKIVSWPSIAETNFKAVVIYVTKVYAAQYIILTSTFICVWLMYAAHV